MDKTTTQSGGCADGSLGDGNVPYEDIEENHRGLVVYEDAVQRFLKEIDLRRQEQKSKEFKVAFTYYVVRFLDVFVGSGIEKRCFNLDEGGTGDLKVCFCGTLYTYPFLTMEEYVSTLECKNDAYHTAFKYFKALSNPIFEYKYDLKHSRKYNKITDTEFCELESIRNFKYVLNTFFMWSVLNDTGFRVVPLSLSSAGLDERCVGGGDPEYYEYIGVGRYVNYKTRKVHNIIDDINEARCDSIIEGEFDEVCVDKL